MIRNNDEFKAEILRRKETYIKRRRARIFACGTGMATLALCVAILSSFPGIRGENLSNGIPEGETSDVLVYIYLSDRTLTEWEDIGPRLEALGKYAPLPEEEDAFEESESASMGSQTADGVPQAPSADNAVSTGGALSTDDAKDRTDGCLNSDNIPVVSFTVFVGSESKTYYLRNDSITVDRKSYPLTGSEFEELFALFGREESK